MLTIPKKTIVAAATIAPAILLGVIIATPGTNSAPKVTRFADTSATQSTSTGTQTAPASSQLSVTTDPTIIDPSAQTTTQSTNTSATTQTTTATDPAPAPIVATNAALSDFSAPQPVQGAPDGTVKQDQYCIYTYSDGSTQERLYQTRYSKGNTIWGVDPSFDCTLATAPAAQ